MSSDSEWTKTKIDGLVVEVRVSRGRTELRVEGREVDARSKEAVPLILELHNRGML